MLTRHTQLRIKSKVEYPFLMELTRIMWVFHPLLITLVLATHSLVVVSGYAQVGLNYTQLILLHRVFVKKWLPFYA